MSLEAKHGLDIEPTANAGTLDAGTQVGAYTLIEAVEKSCHGVVYRARIAETDEEVWLQEFLPVGLAGRRGDDDTIQARQGKTKQFEEALTLFLKEARILSQIRDPYVVRIREYTEARGTAFMAMDLEHGVNLDAHLAHVGRIAEKELRQLFIPLLKGLRVIHSHDLLHRDINPRNVFIRETGPPLITGFGSTQREITAGDVGLESRVTPGYSAIEQYHEQGDLGPWTDLYAMGAVLYKCMTGITPIDATKRVTDIAEGKEDPLVPAMEIGNGDYHTSILAGVDWMLQPVIDRRPASAGDVLGPLSEPVAPRALPDQPVSARGLQTQMGLRIPPTLHADPTARVAPPPPGGARSRRSWTWLIPTLFFIGVGVFAFWPQIKGLLPTTPASRDSSQARIEGTGIPEDILDQPLPEGEQPPELPPKLTFSRAEDDTRANEYRRIESLDRSIRALLESARTKFEADRLIRPPADNALAEYRAILVIDEDNVDARQGIDEIEDALLRRVRRDIESGAWDAAESLVTELKEVDLAGSELPELRREIDRRRANRETGGATRDERADDEQEAVAEAQRLQQERATEAQPLAARAAEQERIREAAIAEAQRLQQERAAEAQRLQQERAAETQRLAARAAEQERAREAAIVEAQRLQQERAAEAQRLAAQAAIDEQRRKEAEKRREIKELLLQATLALDQGTSTESAGPTALAYYREVLELDPDNQEAESGIANVVRFYVGQANDALAVDRFDEVARLLLFISSIDPENEAVDLLRDQMRVRREAIARAELEAEQQQVASNRDQTGLSEVDRFSLEQGIKAYYRGDYQTAFELLRPLAEKDNQRAQFRVGVMYLRGRGVEPDPDTGTAWIRRAFPDIQSAAAEGEAWAQADLGSLYQDGLLVAQNDNEAVRWYLLAAEQGYAGAQTNLGTMYANGRGVNQSRSEAIKWLKRAAEQGDKIAQDNLAALGVPDDDNDQSRTDNQAKQ